MRERVKRLAADDFEGRGPGTAGGRRAAQYIADQLKLAGVKPANKGSYFQNVKLGGVKADPNTKLMAGKDSAESYQFGRDFVATTGAQSSNTSVSADLIFVGYGIDAPLYRWNDYKGSPEDTAARILKSSGLDLESLRDQAKRRDFQPVKAGSVSLNLKSETQTFDSPNVAGILEGEKGVRHIYRPLGPSGHR